MNKYAVRIILCLALLALECAQAQLPDKPRKPPVGVPSDATLFNGKWYRLYTDKMNWDGARQRCVTLGGQLAVVPDAPTWTFLRPFCKGLTLWLGASDEETEGLWKWVDGTPMTFKAWHRHQPDNAAGKQNHLSVTGTAWDDRNKNDLLVGFVCEWKDR